MGSTAAVSLPDVVVATPHVAAIPSFPPSIFRRHSPSAPISLCLSLCLSPSRPSGSICQTTRFQRPYDILHPSSRCHTLFTDLQHPASLASPPQLVGALETTIHCKTNQNSVCFAPNSCATIDTLAKFCCNHSRSTTSLHGLVL